MRHVTFATLKITILIALVSGSASAGQAPSQRGRRGLPEKNSAVNAPPKGGEGSPAEEINLIRSFAERALDFRAFNTKVETLEALGSSLWKYDRPLARSILSKTFELINAEVAKTLDGGMSSEAHAGATRARNRFIAKVARLDPAFAKSLLASLIESESPEEPGKVNYQKTSLYAAMSLLESDPEKAVEFAERSLSFGVSRDIIFFLNKLRLKNAPGADSLFLKAVNRFGIEPTGGADVLMYLGSYIYTSPSSSPQEGGVSFRGVGNVSLVDLSAARPNISPLLTRAFLNVAVDVLSRPVADAEQKKLYYILSRQLYPRVMESVPARAPLLAASMSNLTQDLPQNLVMERGVRPAEAGDGETETGSSGDRADVPKSDLAYLFEVRDLLLRNDFTKARARSAKIRDGSVRRQLTNMCAFYEASWRLEEDPAGAEKAAERLDGVEQAALLLGIASKHFKGGDGGRGFTALQGALKTIRRLDDSRRPSLLLTAAVTYSTADVAGARQIFMEAVKEFKAQDVERSSQAAWSRVISINDFNLDFSLTVKGLETGFNRAVKTMVITDREETLSFITGLREENVFGPAAVAAAQTILD